ncbi:MAG: hypothetical protein A2512_03450 [Deltaproteobacteria bacterium RIFOXYD12_FULL_56_24]|nr:MAG: hypothetical protein A2512_03450 [Deltaproteobacteria bacterium RIFOXYD12_FULL_56_24]
MRKRISTLALAGLLALPAVASAADAADMQAKIDAMSKQIEQMKAQMAEIKTSQEQKFEDFDAKSEKWDLASRFQWSGDIRNRADFHTADTAAYYKATDVATGIYDFIDIAGTNGFLSTNGPGGTVPLANFGLTVNSTVTDLLNNLGPALAGGQAAFVGAATGAGLSTQQATDTFALFSNPSAGALVQQYAAAGYTVGQLLGAMSTPETLAGIMRNLSAADRASIFANMYGAYSPTAAKTYDNDTLYSTRLRLNLRAKATEDVEVKARIVGYKVWGMQDSVTPEQDLDGVHNTDSPYFLNSRSFDGTAGRQPGDNKLILDRAFMNWNNIGGLPVWFSAGRRPTTDGPPAHLRMGNDERMATPVAYMDYPFDGISLGYAYNNLFGLQDAPGRIRFCYGRGFENGPQEEDTGISDVDFAGLSWDVYSKGNRFINIQSFGAFNIFNVPGDTYFPNPLELAADAAGLPTANQYLDRKNMGNIFQTAAVFMDKFQNLNYFITGGWSHTEAKGMDEMGTSLLGDFWAPLEDTDGYSVALGVRYDIPDSSVKLGAEFNHGSKNWLAFAPGHDDMYSSKMATRGNVYEVYGIYDIPAGEAVSKYGKAFIRLGFQHYDYDYTYSGMWLGTPNKIEDIKNDPLAAQFYAPIESMNQVYLTLEASF